MPEKRIKVWVQRFKDRTNLMLQWVDPETGKIRSRSAETANPKAAEAARGDLESDLNNGRFKDAGRMTWEAFRERFEEEHVKPLRPSTRLNYSVMLDQFEQLCSPSQLGKITARTVSAFVTALRGDGAHKDNGPHMASTIKSKLQYLHKALAWAVSQKMLAECPAFPKVKVPEKLPQPVPLESFERILAKAAGDAQMEAYLLTGWLAGLRLAEAYELEWEPTTEAPYLDLAHNRIVLPAEFVKGVKDQWVPLDPKLREALEALPRHGKKVFHFTPRSCGRDPSQDMGRRVHSCTMSKRVIDLAKRAGVRLSMHTLRKGFGCRYAGKVPAQVLQKLMRHRNIKTTMDYYANVDDAVMSAVLGPKVPECNTQRNTPAQPAQAEKRTDAARA